MKTENEIREARDSLRKLLKQCEWNHLNDILIQDIGMLSWVLGD